MYTKSPTRRRRNKRISSSRLSSDTAPTSLPGYYDTRPRDPPPDYEADSSSVEMEIPSPSRGNYSPRERQSPRRRRPKPPALVATNMADTGEALLDSLLERSVHALEMSNSLLQSSMTTEPSVQRIRNRSYHSADDSSEEGELDLDWLQTTRRVGGSTTSPPQREQWVEDMDEISRTVDNLLFDNTPHLREGSTSASLPTSSPIQSLAHRQKKRRPSLDHIASISTILEPTTPPVELQQELGETSSRQLTHAPQERQNLISPPPRALTQYITHEEADALALPSTLGVRGSQLKSTPSSPTPYGSPTFNSGFDVDVTTPKIDGLPSSSSAYTILSSLVAKPSTSNTTTPPRSPFPSPPGTHRSSSSVSSFVSSKNSPFSFSGLKGNRNRWSVSSQSTVASKSSVGTVPDKLRRRRSLDNSTRASSRSPRTSNPGTPKTRSISPHQYENSHRSHEQTIPEESSLSSSSSSSDLHAEQTITCLRQILISHPPPPPKETEIQTLLRTKRPKFTPRSGNVQPDMGSSSATASVSKLFSRGVIGGKHTSATRERSPPGRSSLKGGRRRRDLALSSASASGSGTQTPLTQDGTDGTFLSVPPTPSTMSGSVTPSSLSSSQSATASLTSSLPPHPPITNSRVRIITESTRKLWSKGWNAAAASTPSLPLPWHSSPSASTSGTSTPASQKRISFAELPEASTSTLTGKRSESTLRGGRRKRRSSSSSSSKRRNAKKRRSSGSSGSRSSSDEESSNMGAGWLSWFIPPAQLTSPCPNSITPGGSGPGHGSRAMMGSFRTPGGEGLDVWGGI